MTATGDLRHSFRALLFGIARKQLLRHFEGRGALRGEDMMSRISIVDLQTTPTQRIAKEEEMDLLHRALATLPVDAQIALELRYWRKMPADEIAFVLGLSPAGARTRLHRARALLRERFESLSEGRATPELVER